MNHEYDSLWNLFYNYNNNNNNNKNKITLYQMINWKYLLETFQQNRCVLAF